MPYPHVFMPSRPSCLCGPRVVCRVRRVCAVSSCLHVLCLCLGVIVFSCRVLVSVVLVPGLRVVSRVVSSCRVALFSYRVSFRSRSCHVLLCRVRCCVVSSCHNYPRGVMSFLCLCVVSSCRIRSHCVVSSCTVSCLRLVSYLCVASSCLHVVSLSSCRVLVLSSCPVFVSNLPCQSFLVCIRVCGSCQAIAARLRLSSYASATASARTQHDHLLTIHT